MATCNIKISYQLTNNSPDNLVGYSYIGNNSGVKIALNLSGYFTSYSPGQFGSVNGRDFYKTILICSAESPPFKFMAAAFVKYKNSTAAELNTQMELCFVYLDKDGKLNIEYGDTISHDSLIISDTPAAGLSSLFVTADSGINHILYNNVTYDTFPATIPLDAATTTMQVESKSPVLTINDGGNLKSVTYGSATYTKFPATVTATTPEFAVTARGKDSPVITVRTERTQSPVITNT